MQLLKEIDQLEEKLNIKEYKKSSILIQDLDSQNFDIKTFFKSQFCQGKEVNYEKIDNSIETIQNIQKDTCEQIAVSVDINLEKYVQICSQFETMKEYFNQTDQLYKGVVDKMQTSKDSCINQIQNVNEILDNYNLVCEFEQNLLEMKKLIQFNKEIENNITIIKMYFEQQTQQQETNNSIQQNENQNQIQQSNLVDINSNQDLKKNLKNQNEINKDTQKDNIKTIQFPGFKILHTCKLLNECKDLFKKKIEIGLQTRELSQKYNLVQNLNEKANLIIQLLDSNLEITLKAYLNIDHSKQIKKQNLFRQIAVLFNALAILNQQKQGEKKVAEVLIKPEIDIIFEEALKNKTNMITATKQQYMEQQQKQKQMSITIISEGIRNFIDNTFKTFINIFQQNNDKYRDYKVNSKCYDFVKLLWEEIYKKMNSKDIIFIYSVGVPDVFFLNYSQSILLIKYLKFQYNNKQPQNLQYETEKKFLQKWNLQTYFSLRYSDIVKNFEKDLNTQLQKLEIQGENPQVNTDLANVLKKYVQMCLDKNRIFIDKLFLKFVKLIFQLSHKFSESLTQYSLKNQIKNIPLINTLSDLQKEISDLFLQKVIENLKLNQNDERYQIMVNLQNELKNILKQALKGYLQSAMKDTVNSCYDQLETLNSIPQKFRIHGKDMPTKPSNVCSNILMGLSTFLQKNQLQPEGSNLIKEFVISKAFQKFLELKKEILESSQKSQEIMQKLQNNNKQNSQFTEHEKIQEQFTLDQQEIEEIIKTKFQIQNIQQLIQQQI